MDRLRLAPPAVPSDLADGQSKGKRSTGDSFLSCMRKGRERTGGFGRPFRPPSHPSPNPFSLADAQWFMTLPEKVRRKHFTKEEQLLLSTYSQRLIPDAADDIFGKLGHRKSQSIPTLSTSADSSKSSAASAVGDFLIGPDSDMDDPTADGFRWMDDDDELDLSLDDYHANIEPTTDAVDQSAPRRPSFRRSLSLTNLPFGIIKSLTKVPPHPKAVEPPPILPMLSHQRGNIRPPEDPKPNNGVISATKHYQDPEARLKLRVYLASPQKFDEALEFGFPSLEDRVVAPSRRPSVSKHHTDSILHTFFDEDNISRFDWHDWNHVETSVAEIDSSKKSPETFFCASDRCQRSDDPAATRSNGSVQYDASSRTALPYAQAMAGSREMTLRMTLTRPDLRANEKPLYATENDPLALQHLPPSANAGEMWDHHAKEGMVKKLWHKMSRKPSAT